MSIISTTLLCVLGFGLYTILNMKDDPVTTTTTVVAKNSEPKETVAGIIAGDSILNDFEKYLKDTAQFSALDSATPYTVFAFTNDGYKKASDQLKALFSNDEKAGAKKDIVNYHIVSGNVEPSAMNEGQKLKTMNGSEIVVKKENQNIYLVDMKGNSVKVEKAGIPAKNGSVYIISGILLPQ